jgi:glycosyltransferase involved in cell wall biosynthesis
VERVAFVTNSLSGGGAEYSASLLHHQLQSNGLKSYWIGINSENPAGVKVSQTVLSLDRDKSKGPIHTLGIFIRYALLMRKLRITTIVTNCELPELLTSLLPMKIRIIVVEHANPTWYKRDLLGFLVRKILIARKAKFVVVGNHLKPRFSRDNNYVHIPNPMPDITLKFSKLAIGKARRLLYVGRLSPDFKCPQLILELASRTNLKVAARSAKSRSRSEILWFSKLSLDVLSTRRPFDYSFYCGRGWFGLDRSNYSWGSISCSQYS